MPIYVREKASQSPRNDLSDGLAAALGMGPQYLRQRVRNLDGDGDQRFLRVGLARPWRAHPGRNDRTDAATARSAGTAAARPRSARPRRGMWTSGRGSVGAMIRTRHSTFSASTTSGRGRGRAILSCASSRPETASRVRSRRSIAGARRTGMNRSRPSMSILLVSSGATATTTAASGIARACRASAPR